MLLEKGADRLAEHRVATKLQFEKETQYLRGTVK